MKYTIFLAMLFVTASAEAQKLVLGEPRAYWQGGIGSLIYKETTAVPSQYPSNDFSYQAAITVWGTRLGYDFNSIFGAYIGLGAGLTTGSDSVNGIEVDSRLDNTYQAGVRVGIPVAAGFIYPYVTIGRTKAAGTISAYGLELANISATDTHKGFGFELRNDKENWFGAFEYQSLIDKSNPGGSAALNGIFLNFGTTF